MKNMDNTLWSAIEAFKLDNQGEEYGFSIRLAIENNWTSYFTETAIIEYKKFMYLAATSNEMVSPSAVVDVVWHQHLIFTNSYADLCRILNKKIEHIPSTHNKSEKEKFERATQRTKALYEQQFGEQPSEIWQSSSQNGSINLTKSDVDFSVFNLNYYWLALVLTTFPVYYFIKPLLLKIQNPDFLNYYTILFIAVLIFSALYTKSDYSKLIDKIKSNAIIRNLSAFELIYIQKGKLTYVIHGIINNLIRQGKIQILKKNNRLQLVDENPSDNPYENCIIEIMKEFDPMPYQQLINNTIEKPIFEQLRKSGDAIQFHITKSREYLKPLIISHIALGIVLIIGYSRLLSGMLRDKPVIYILFFCVSVLLVVSIVFVGVSALTVSTVTESATVVSGSETVN